MEKMLLEDCCEILDSMRVPITASDRKEGPYPYYGANGIQDYVSDYIFDDELVLLAEDGGNFGSKERPIAYRVSGKCWVNNHAHVLKPKDGLNVDYLCFSLMFYNTDGLVNGATRKKLTQATMRKMLIPKRNMLEQIDIVYKLNAIRNIIQMRRSELQIFDDLIKARFVEMFGDIITNEKDWPTSTIGEISTSRLGKMLDAKKQTGKWKFPYLANQNVQWFHFDLNKLNMMDFDEADQKEFELREGDLMITEGGEVGRCAVWHDEITPCFYQKAIHRVRCNVEVVLPDYLAFWFKMHADYNRFEDIVGGVTSIAHLPGVKLKRMAVVLPPINLQERFVEFIRQVDKSKVAVQKSLDETKLLFDSLMQEYFG